MFRGRNCERGLHRQVNCVRTFHLQPKAVSEFRCQHTLSHEDEERRSRETASTKALIHRGVAGHVFHGRCIGRFQLLGRLRNNIIRGRVINYRLKMLQYRLLNGLSPGAKENGRVNFVRRHGVFATFRNVFGSSFRSALGLEANVRIHVVHLIVILMFLARMRTANRFTSTGRVNTVRRFHAGKELVRRAFRNLRKASINGRSRFLTRDRRTLLKARFNDEIVIRFQIACNERRCDVHVFADLVDNFKGQIARLICHIYATSNVFVIRFVSRLLARNDRRVRTCNESFKTSAIANRRYGFGVRYFLCCLGIRLSSFYLRSSYNSASRPARGLLSVWKC